MGHYVRQILYPFALRQNLPNPKEIPLVLLPHDVYHFRILHLILLHLRFQLQTGLLHLALRSHA